MRNRFRYTPPRPLNLVTYAVALAMVLPAIHHWGGPAWAQVVDTFGVYGALIGGGFAFYMVWFWAIGGLYLVADARGWWAKYRIQLRKPGVARRGPTLARAVTVVLGNQLLGTLPALVLLTLALEARGVDLAAPPPGVGTIALHLVIFVMVEELLFYTVHRTLHAPRLFRRFHRIHHEFRESIGIATHYVHPVEHWVGNLMPVFAGVLLVGAHPVTILLWVTLAVANAIHTHAGYALPTMTWAIDHDFHHHNIKGSYGVLGLLDRITGTDAELRRVAKRGR